jgi:pilus assembly protein CpaE
MAKILIVDDDRDILRMLEFALKRAGHEPMLASNGIQGLEIIQNSQPHLVIADVMMPEMTGYDFTRQVRNFSDQADLPILIYSARFQTIDKKTAQEAGATDYVPKSIAPAELIKKINNLLGDAKPETVATQNQSLAVFSLHGGAGVTMLAVNLAVILALSNKTPVSLTDLNMMAGHAGLMLGLRPQKDVQALLLGSDPLTSDRIKSHMTDHSSGVTLLSSPLTPSDNAAHHAVPDLVSALRADYRFSVLDLPHTLTAEHLALLPDLTKLILVISPDVPALQSTAAAWKYLRQNGIASENIIPVLNRNSPVPGLSIETIQKTIRREVGAEIPFEAHMMTAINNGQPIVLHQPKSATAKALAQLALKLIKS